MNKYGDWRYITIITVTWLVLSFMFTLRIDSQYLVDTKGGLDVGGGGEKTSAPIRSQT
jgi:hypothetical protein